MQLEKCCFCISLKYGFLGYGTLCLAGRVGICLMIFLSQESLTNSNSTKINSHSVEAAFPVIGLSTGWAFSTAFALYIALKGIIQSRSILLFPYIVILVVELFITVLYNIIAACMGHPLILISLLFIIPINIYTILCLVSLYKKMKDKERTARTWETVPVKAI